MPSSYQNSNAALSCACTSRHGLGVLRTSLEMLSWAPLCPCESSWSATSQAQGACAFWGKQQPILWVDTARLGCSPFQADRLWQQWVSSKGWLTLALRLFWPLNDVEACAMGAAMSSALLLVMVVLPALSFI